MSRYRKVTAWALVAASVVAVLMGFSIVRKETAPTPVQPPGDVSGQGYAYLSNDPTHLFRVGNRRDLPDEAGLVPHEGNEAGNRHVVHVSRQAAENAAATKGRLAIQLPAGERFAVQFERAERAPNGDWTFIGKVATRLGPQSAVLTFGRAGLFGVLPTPQGSQMQISTTRGVTVLESVRPIHPRNPQTGELPVDYVFPEDATRAPTAPGDELPPQAGLSKQSVSLADTTSTAGATAAAAEVQVDVLGLYTKNMTELRGSAAAAESECNNYLAVANQAHQDSDTGIRLNFAGLRQVDYPAPALNQSALRAMAQNQMPDGTDVKQLRDSLRADLVAMLRPYATGDSNGGIAYLAGSGLQGAAGAWDGAGFSVSNLSAYTFAHEIGHNLGSMHDIQTSTNGGIVQYGAYVYSFGYRQDGPPKFATIMAYPTNGQPWIGYFSHPGTLACLGAACGTEAADNARSKRNMASAIAEYRLPPGLILTSATASVLEGDPGNLWTRTLNVTVKLSTPAPVGGVRFDVATSDGTARAGADYVALSQTGVSIAEGQLSRTFSITVLPDELVEGDENFRFMISGVAGAQVYRSEAIATIRDDDPRVFVSGRFLPPSGLSLPTSRFQIGVYETGPLGSDPASYWVTPPDFQYRLPVQSGSSVSIEVMSPPPPYAGSSYALGTVNASRIHDLTLKRAVRLSGRLGFPAGQPLPTAPISVIAWGSKGTDGGVGVAASPPDFRFSFDVVQGAQIRLDAANPPAPYVRQQIAIGEVWSDRVQDIEMGSIPSLVVAGVRVTEGASGENREVRLSVYLSTAAPAAGAHADVDLIGGTASAGLDFVSRARTRLTIGAGSNWSLYAIVIKGDSIPERAEYLKVVLSNPSGAWLPSPEAIVYIDDDDPGIPRSDANGDGRSDLFWHNESAQQFAWWLMDGVVRTGGSGQDVASGYRVIGAGDLNGDGLRDMVWRDVARRELYLWRGMPGGQYLVHPLGQHPDGDYSLAGVGDVDGDGKDDLLWHSRTRGTLAWWLMDGPSRRSGGSSAINALYEVAGVGDLNGDGRADVVWRDSARTQVWLWAGQPGGGFAARFISAHPPAAWKLIGVEDLDGDGRADLVWHDAVMGQIDSWLMDGETRRGVMSQAVPTQYEVVAFADLNGDGRRDLVWSDRARTELWSWLATAQGIFIPKYIAGHPVGGWQLVTSPGTDYPQQTAARRARTDINGDGRSDLTWRNTNTQRTAWWLMNGPAFTIPAEQAAGAQFSIVARSDFDGDGRQDMLWTDSARSQLWMWIARGTSFEVHPMGAHPPSGWTVVASADVDGDGRSDVLWHNPDLQQLDWWYMDGARRVAMGSQFIPRQYRVVVAADLDGDRRSDLVWRDLASTELWRWAGDGYSFSPSWISPYPPGWSVVAAGDLDGDSRDDLVWHNAAAGQVDWWRMRGAERIGMGSQAIPSRYALADYGDMDGDGRLDLVWVDDRRTEIWVWHEAAANRSMRVSYVGAHPNGEWAMVSVH